MTTYFEVRSSSKPDGEGEIMVPSRYLTREDAEKAAERESRIGFFSSVWKCGEVDGDGDFVHHTYLCEYAPARVAA